MSGPALPTAALEGTALRDSVHPITNEMSDERADGEQETTVNCDFVEDGESVVGEGWGTLVLANAGGTWDGTFTGTTTWSVSEPDHVHVMDAIDSGAGGYDGLRLVTPYEGTDSPWSITGRIEPAD
ncbi:MAG: hypothetical protein ACERLM_05605 [Acidimicrobiales bacterium]